jgi:tetratricopeptide (TPR) repeat protein
MVAPPPAALPTPQELFTAALGLHQAGRLAEAERLYRRILHIQPGHAGSLHLLGMLALRAGHLDGARSLVAAALESDGESALYHASLGDILQRQGRSVEAAASFRAVVLLRPDCAEAYANLAALLAGRGDPGAVSAAARRAVALRPEAAPNWYALALALPETAGSNRLAAARAALVCRPDYGRAHNLAGLMLVERGDLAGAARCYRRALACQRDPSFYANLADLIRFRPGGEDLAAMEELAADAESLDEAARIPLHFALGKAYQDCGEDEAAFHHYREGNRRKRRALAYDEAATLAAMARTEREFSAEMMARHRGEGDPSEIPIFILGMPRSGSTLIEQILASHPGVQGGDERPDFPELLEALGGDFAALGAAYVERCRALAPGAARLTDKLPGNFRHAGAIHLALPKARIIHSRRAAADTCLSCFTKLFRGEQAYTYDLGELGRYYRAYARLMAHWRAVLPASVFLEVDYEELVGDPETQTRRLLAHCGLEWDSACLAFHQTRRAVRTASAAQVRQPLHRGAIGRWRRYETLLAPLLAELEAP